MKTKPGRVARFDHVQHWILRYIDNPTGLQISGNLVRAYFRPGEVGNPQNLPTVEAVKAWGAEFNIEVWYVESTDTFHFLRAAFHEPPITPNAS